MSDRQESSSAPSGLRRALTRLVPKPVTTALQRRRAVRRYLETVSPQMLDRQARLEDLEEQVANESDGLYERIVSDVVQRTEVILEELNRRIDAVAERTDKALGAMERELGRLEQELTRLRGGSDGPVDNRTPAATSATRPRRASGHSARSTRAKTSE